MPSSPLKQEDLLKPLFQPTIISLNVEDSQKLGADDKPVKKIETVHAYGQLSL